MLETVDMLRVFQQYRGDAFVVPARIARHWTHISTRPMRDVPLGDPAMGGHASFVFGLALAQPDKKFVLFDSEGDVLMSTVILATIAEHQPKNFYHFMLDNECYANTGGQPAPNATNISYDVIARGYGYARTYAYDKLETFAANIERILGEPGPVFVALKVVAEVMKPENRHKRWQPPSRDHVIRRLRQELGIDG